MFIFMSYGVNLSAMCVRTSVWHVHAQWSYDNYSHFIAMNITFHGNRFSFQYLLTALALRRDKKCRTYYIMKKRIGTAFIVTSETNATLPMCIVFIYINFITYPIWFSGWFY